MRKSHSVSIRREPRRQMSHSVSKDDSGIISRPYEDYLAEATPDGDAPTAFSRRGK